MLESKTWRKLISIQKRRYILNYNYAYKLRFCLKNNKKMANVIEPRVNVVDYGPFQDEITSDEFVYGAAGITYKDIGALSEVMELKKSEANIAEKIRKSLIKSAGAGHASMATTPGLWVFLEGDCSKLVDSLFTGARFSSSLMPSGRRVPIAKDQIVVPRNIHDAGTEVEGIYVKSIENSIDVYERLQERGVEKQEASKIVPYGHRGGGFMFMPLETLIAYSKDFEANLSGIPREGIEIVNQLEDFVKTHGMDVTYEARKNSPRTSSPNPGIFHSRTNLAQEIVNENRNHVLDNPILLNLNHIPSNERDARIINYFENREAIFSAQKLIEFHWKEALSELDEIVQDYNNSISVTTASNSPWRVWGEVKRHRTLPHTVESIYHAVERAVKLAADMPSRTDNGVSYEDWPKVVSVPNAVKEKDNFNLWINTFKESLSDYTQLVRMGIPESDAIGVIPRGIKLGIVKQWDLYNLTTGYMSLRLCTTAEPEMRRTTEQERQLVLDSNLPNTIKGLIMPKCGYTGFCPDRNCGVVKKYVDFYDADVHKALQTARENEILRSL